MKRIILIAVFFVTTVIGVMSQTSLNQRILFAADSTNVSESQMAQVEVLVDYLRNNPAQNIIIAGFTSSRTPANLVDAITQKRADAVKELLVQKYGIDPQRLLAVGVGVSTRYDVPEFNEVVSFMK